MIYKNYVTTIFRLFTKQKLYSLINVLGLSIAIAFSLLVFLFINDERSFDNFHKDSERTYYLKFKRLDEIALSGGEYSYTTIGVLSNGLAHEIKSSIPEVESITQIKMSNGLVKVSDNTFEQTVHFTDSSFFDLLSFQIISGSVTNIFEQPNDIVISEKAALKYFGNSNVVGQVLSLKLDEISTAEFTIKAVIKVPGFSTLKPEILLSINTYPDYLNKGWSAFNYNTFVKLKSQFDIEKFKSKADTIISKNRAVRIERVRKEYKLSADMPIEEIDFTPVNKIHFDKDVHLSVPASDKRYSWILSGIALLIILIASINYVSFALASSANRSKEIGIRKVIGASPIEIYKQLNIESILLAAVASIIGLLICLVCLPIFNFLTEKIILFTDLELTPLFGVLILLVFVLGIFSGSYPAFHVAHFKPSHVLQTRQTIRTRLMKPLVVLQFSFSAFLMISGIIMYRQMYFIATTDLGFNDNAVIALPTNLGWNEESDKAIERFRNRVSGNSLIEYVTGTVSSFGKGYNAQTFKLNEEEIWVTMNKADDHYLSLLGVPLLKGRNFIPESRADSNAVIVNEAFVDRFQLTDPINEVIKPTGDSKDSYKIIGVIKNFHFKSLDNEIEPLLLKGPTGDMHFITMMIKLNAKNIPEALILAQNTWKELYPDKPFNYTFIDDDIAAQYQSYSKWMMITGIATAIALLIAGLGLFGLSGIQAVNRTKEISIRKVLGAETVSLFLLLNKPFIKMALIAFLIATPISWNIMDKWLLNFKYHVDIGWELFLVSLISGLFIALLSVSYHGIKILKLNPVDALKAE